MGLFGGERKKSYIGGRIDPPNIREQKQKQWEKVEKAMKNKDPDGAIDPLKRILEIDEKDSRALCRLGWIFVQKGYKENAAHYLIRGAEEYSKDGFYPKAIAVYKEVLELDDSLMDVREKMAVLYDKLNLFEDAVKLRRIISSASAAKEEEVLKFIEGKRQAADNGDESARKFLKGIFNQTGRFLKTQKV
ncbi:MAG: hypothetical protein WC460_01380 [Patescibacteria group bacterium]